MKISIVGSKFVDAEEFVASMKVGAELTLVREPHNKFDQYALAVWSGSRKIGYVPKTHNREIVARMVQMAFDNRLAPLLAINAKFVRSPNSGYPMAEINMEPRNVESPSAAGPTRPSDVELAREYPVEGQPEAEGQAGSEEGGIPKG